MEVVLSNDLIEISAEINVFKQQAGQAVCEIGKRLKHVRDNDLAHGQWGSWLESIDVDRTSAHRMIQAYEQFSNVATSQQLPTGKIFEMLSLPESIDRQEFLNQTHTIPSTGEQKTVDDMTVKEMREVKKALHEAEQRAATAEATATAEKNTARHYEKLWQQEKSRPPVVQTKTEVIEKVPEDYHDLKEQAVLAQQLNNENVKLQQQMINLRQEHAEKTTRQQDELHNIRKMREAFKSILSSVTQEQYNARFHFDQAGHTPQAHESVEVFLREFGNLVDAVFNEWKEKIQIKAS